MKKTVLGITIISLCVLISSNANASIDIFGYTFDDNAFSDDAELISGKIRCFNGWNPSPLIDLRTALNGSNLHGYVEGDWVPNSPDWHTYTIDVLFTDNYLFNGAGADIAVFERYVPAAFNFAIFNPLTNAWSDEKYYQTVFLGNIYEDGDYREVNLALVNFDDFGIDTTTPITKARIATHWPTLSPNIAALGGLNSIDGVPPAPVPEPCTMVLFGIGSLAMALMRRKY